jgi:hypothetical protein
MTQYIRKAVPVQAFQYDKQPQKDWPKWLQDYTVTTTMGIQPVGSFGGLLNIPQKHGPTVNVNAGEWVVLENGALSVYKNEAFEAAFRAETVQAPEAAEAPAAGETTETVVTETPAADAAAAPAETPAAEPAAAEQPAPTTGRGRGKASGGAAAAEDAPAADAEA